MYGSTIIRHIREHPLYRALARNIHGVAAQRSLVQIDPQPLTIVQNFRTVTGGAINQYAKGTGVVRLPLDLF